MIETTLSHCDVSVREMVQGDIALMAAMFADPAMNYEMASLLGATPEAQADAYAGWIFRMPPEKQRTRYWLAIEGVSGFAGTTTLTLDSKIVGGADNLGWIVGPLHRRRGYALRATALLVRTALKAGRTDFAAVMSPDNGASIHISERLGMRVRGTTEIDHPLIRETDGSPKKALLYRGAAAQVTLAVASILDGPG